MNKNGLKVVVMIAAFILSVAQVKAQEKPVTIGVKAGVNLSTFSGDIKNTKSTFKYQVGMTADILIVNNFYVLTGMEFQTKGSKYEPKTEPKIKYNPMYLSVPMQLGYKFQLSSGTKLTINAGPYIAYGIGGKIKSGDNSEKIFGDNKFKRFDYGIRGGVGLEFGNFCINGGYDLGLNNVSDIKGTKIKNRNTYMALGYKF